MLKRLLASILFFVFGSATSASAIDLVCTVPTAAVTEALLSCEFLRVELGLTPAQWSNDICATQTLRVGLRTITERRSRLSADDARTAAIRASLLDFQTNWPRPNGAAQ